MEAHIFILIQILIRFCVGLTLILGSLYGIMLFLKHVDKKDTRWDLSVIKEKPIAVSIYSGFLTIGVFIYIGLIVAALILGLSTL
jgi:hypothetical protein